MADYTENYNLKKPSAEDFVNIADINGNMDIIDGALKECKEEAGAGAVYCTCDTASNVVAKVATVVRGNFKLETGVAVDVKFTKYSSVGSPTLNVNGTGAKPIIISGTIGARSSMWNNGALVRFVYDGASWLMQNGSSATASTYGVTKLSSSYNSTSTSEAATPSAVKAAYDLANAAIPKTQIGAADGVASLDLSGKVPMSQIPDEVAQAGQYVTGSFVGNGGYCSGGNGSGGIENVTTWTEHNRLEVDLGFSPSLVLFFPEAYSLNSSTYNRYLIKHVDRDTAPMRYYSNNAGYYKIYEITENGFKVGGFNGNKYYNVTGEIYSYIAFK